MLPGLLLLLGQRSQYFSYWVFWYFFKPMKTPLLYPIIYPPVLSLYYTNIIDLEDFKAFLLLPLHSSWTCLEDWFFKKYSFQSVTSPDSASPRHIACCWVITLQTQTCFSCFGCWGSRCRKSSLCLVCQHDAFESEIRGFAVSGETWVFFKFISNPQNS